MKARFRYDLTDLALFLATAQEGGLVKGAERMHMSNASASQRIQKLEEALDAKLFVRRSQGLKLTPAGEVFARNAQTILRATEDAETDLWAFTNERRGIVTISANSNGCDLVANRIADFLIGRGGAKDIKFRMHQRLSSEVIDDVQTGRADFGICVWNLEVEDLRQFVFYEDHHVLLVPRGHPLEGVSSVKFRETLDYPQICLTSDHALQRAVSSIASLQGYTLDPVVQVSGFESVIRLVRRGAGCAIVPCSTVSDDNGATCRYPEIKAIPFTDAWTKRTLRCFFHHDEQRRSRIANDFLHHLKETVGRGHFASQVVLD